MALQINQEKKPPMDHHLEKSEAKLTKDNLNWKFDKFQVPISIKKNGLRLALEEKRKE